MTTDVVGHEAEAHEVRKVGRGVIRESDVAGPGRRARGGAKDVPWRWHRDELAAPPWQLLSPNFPARPHPFRGPPSPPDAI